MTEAAHPEDRHMSQREAILRTVLKTRFGITTSKHPAAETQEDELFIPGVPPLLHRADGQVAPEADTKAVHGGKPAWSMVCLFSKEQKGVSLCPSLILDPAGGAARKYRASELLLQLCDAGGYEDDDGVTWRVDKAKRSSRKRICLDAACISPWHRDLNPNEEKRWLFTERRHLYASRCAALGIVDQGGPVTSLVHRSATAEERPAKRSRGDECDNEDQRVTTYALPVEDTFVSSGHPRMLGWIDNVKVWMSDTDAGGSTLRVIMDFMPTAPRGSSSVKAYRIRDIEGDCVRIESVDSSQALEPRPIGARVPVSVEVEIAVQVKYHCCVSCCGDVTRAIDFSRTLEECGGRDALLDKVRRGFLNCAQTRARVLPPPSPI